jgi:hypothetical protein
VNYIKILGFIFQIPNCAAALTAKQSQKITALLHSNSLQYKELEIKILSILFSKSIILRFFFPMFTVEQVMQCLGFVHFITKPNYQTQLFVNNGLFKRNRDISFIEFVRLYQAFNTLSHYKDYDNPNELIKNISNEIIAIIYRPEQQTKFDDDLLAANTKFIATLHHSIKIEIITGIRKEFDALITAFPKIFSKQNLEIEDENNPNIPRQTDQSKQWFKVALESSKDITKFEEVLYLNAAYVLFDLENNIEKNEELKKSYENQK